MATAKAKPERWGFWRHVRETGEQFVTVSGLMLFASLVTTVRVLLSGPEFAVWPAIIWNSMMVFNHTGRWILPQGIAAWLQAKNGQPKSPAS